MKKFPLKKINKNQLNIANYLIYSYNHNIKLSHSHKSAALPRIKFVMIQPAVCKTSIKKSLDIILK